MNRLPAKMKIALAPYSQALATLPSEGQNGRLAALTAVCGLILTVTHYFATRRGFDMLPLAPGLSGDTGAWIFLYWLACLLVLWVAVPAWFSRRFLGLSMRGLGGGLGQTRRCWGVYASLLVLNLPLIWWASRQPAFLGYYPFYKGAGASLGAFLLWEAVYGLQFVCVEFFFRGVLLHGSRRALGGAGAVAFSALPYCMLHFPKPFPEPLLALAMGFALGAASLRAGSIWGGVAVHVAVAVIMDVLALAARPGSIFSGV